MAEIKFYSPNVLTSGGGTLNLPSGVDTVPNADGIEQTYFVTCAATLSGSWTVQSSGTLIGGLKYRIIYVGTTDCVITASNSITIFGIALTQAQAQSKVEIVSDYNGSAWVTHIATSDDNKTIINPGIKDNTLSSGGGTIKLNPAIDKAVQYFSGTATLAGSYVIQGLDTPPAVNHTFWIYYNGALTVGVNSVTIFGLALTPSESLNGGVSIKVDYDLNTSAYRAQRITGAGTAAIPQGHVVYFDTVYGSDATGAVDRLDLPFSTPDAARTAAIALSPNTTTNVVWIEGRGYLTAPIVAYNGICWDITKCDINVAAGNSTHTISDNGVACTCFILANKITRSGTGTGGVYALNTSHASSNIMVRCTDITSSTTNITDAAIGGVAGTLTVNCNNITAYNFSVATAAGTTTVNYNNINSTNGSAIVMSGGTQYTFGNNVTSGTLSGFSCAGGTQNGECNLITTSGSTAAGSCVVSSAGTQSILCKGMTQNNTSSQAIYATSTAIQFVKCSGTITGSSYYGAIVAEALTGSQIVEFEYAVAGNVVINPFGATTGTCRYVGRIKNTGSGNAIYVATAAASLVTIVTDQCETTNGDCLSVASANTTSTTRLRGRFVSGGADKNAIVSAAGASAPILIIEGGSTLVPTGAGASIYSADAVTPVHVYTGVVGKVAVSGNITQLVGTVTVSSSVI